MSCIHVVIFHTHACQLVPPPCQLHLHMCIMYISQGALRCSQHDASHIPSMDQFLIHHITNSSNLSSVSLFCIQATLQTSLRYLSSVYKQIIKFYLSLDLSLYLSPSLSVSTVSHSLSLSPL